MPMPGFKLLDLVRAARDFFVAGVTSDQAVANLRESLQPDTAWRRGYVDGEDGWRSETDDELRARIKARDRKTPGL